MIALWLAAGVLAAQTAQLSSRGDDGGYAYGSGYGRQSLRDIAMRQFEARLEKAARKARKVRNQPEAAGEAVEAIAEVPRLYIPDDLLARLDAVAEAVRLASERQASMAAVIERIEALRIEAERRRKRRQREEEMILNFIARIA